MCSHCYLNIGIEKAFKSDRRVRIKSEAGEAGIGSSHTQENYWVNIAKSFYDFEGTANIIDPEI